MNFKRVALSFVLVVALIAGSALQSVAQDETDNTFGPQDVFGLFMGALGQGDLILLTDGSVVSGNILNTEFILDDETYTDSEVFAMGLTTDDDNNTITRLYVTGQPFIEGTLNNALEHNIIIADGTTLELADISAIVFQFSFQPGPGGRPDQNGRRNFGQIFPIFTRMMGSMSQFDTVVTTEGDLASVVLEDRDGLEITLNSSTFGTFTFGAEDVAWIEFGQDEDARDILVLQNGDRVSGTVSVTGSFSGTLASGNGQFSFDGDQLSSQFRQVVFQINLGTFGGGGARGPIIRPDDNE